MLTDSDFIHAVIEMRCLQREYFKTRSPITLKDAKEAERRVDKMIEDFRSGKQGWGKLC